MDKIKKELDKFLDDEELINRALCFKNRLTENITIGFGFYGGCKSRDPEIDQLKNELTEIDSIIFADSISLGSDEYFKIRELCTRHMHDGR